MTNNYVDIPLQDSPFYELSIALEGNSYIIEFVYNERAQLYFMNLYNSDREAIVLGQALIPEYPIFLDYNLANLSGFFWMLKKATLVSEPYKTYPDSIHQYYDLIYVIPTE